jgi:hypothetical protein
VGDVQDLIAEKDSGGEDAAKQLRRGRAGRGTAGVVARLVTTCAPALQKE